MSAPTMCMGKRRYAVEAEALIVAVRRTHHGAPTLRTYPCRACKGWHLTKRAQRAAA